MSTTATRCQAGSKRRIQRGTRIYGHKRCDVPDHAAGGRSKHPRQSAARVVASTSRSVQRSRTTGRLCSVLLRVLNGRPVGAWRRHNCVANHVWFIWNDGIFLVFSKPGQAKLANIARSPRVSLNLGATDDQEQITIFTGSAEVAEAASVGPDLLDRYAARYADRLPGIGLTREQYEAAYTAVLRVTPEKLRGW